MPWKKLTFSHLFYSLLEGVNLLVSSGTASAIAGDRLRLVKRKTARQDDTKVRKAYLYATDPKLTFLHRNFLF